jgi:hypothetical protein
MSASPQVDFRLRIPEFTDRRGTLSQDSSTITIRDRYVAASENYCKLSWVSFTAQRALLQLPTLTTPCVLKYTLDACPDVLMLSTTMPLVPPG